MPPPSLAKKLPSPVCFFNSISLFISSSKSFSSSAKALASSINDIFSIRFILSDEPEFMLPNRGCVSVIGVSRIEVIPLLDLVLEEVPGCD